MNSKQKGNRGEREFAEWLRDNLGIEARRGQQYSGSPESPDVVSDLPIHIEVKRVERLNLSEAMRQAIRDCGDYAPIVAHRRNREDWMITMRADDLYEVACIIADQCDPDSSLPFANSTKGISKDVTSHKKMPNSCILRNADGI